MGLATEREKRNDGEPKEEERRGRAAVSVRHESALNIYIKFLKSKIK